MIRHMTHLMRHAMVNRVEKHTYWDVFQRIGDHLVQMHIETECRLDEILPYIEKACIPAFILQYIPNDTTAASILLNFYAFLSIYEEVTSLHTSAARI